MTWAVKFEEVSKRYRGGGPRYGSLRHDLATGFKRLANTLAGRRAKPQGTLALDRVSFEVEQGESFAIIGPNGAGKTSALKILSRITYPTGGRARVRGRVGALIEVGSGVHPELTARENIWLYGQILGMSRAEVRRRFDAIVAFAELDQVLDAPVKMYSSGMQLRLGFSIAAHLDPDVLLVDEALAVGDAGFAAKCMRRMRQLVAEGKTLLLVSHNMPAIESTCTRGVLLDAGRVVFHGSGLELVPEYFRLCGVRLPSTDDPVTQGADDDILVREFVVSTPGRATGPLPGDPLDIRLLCESRTPLHEPVVAISLGDGGPHPLLWFSSADGHHQLPPVIHGAFEIRLHLEYVPLAPGLYEVTLWISDRESSLANRSRFHRAVGRSHVVAPGWGTEPVTSFLRASAVAFAPHALEVSSLVALPTGAVRR